MIRFNKDYKFNVPYGHKPERFSKAYITKITNQVKYLEDKLKLTNWVFICQSFDKTISLAQKDDFIYCDPPYIGRHVDYYDSWDEPLELQLHETLIKSKAKFMLSTWDHNIYRKNEYIQSIWHDCYKITYEHFYHIGASEKNRNHITEALITNYKPKENNNILNKQQHETQLKFNFSS